MSALFQGNIKRKQHCSKRRNVSCAQGLFFKESYFTANSLQNCVDLTLASCWFHEDVFHYIFGLPSHLSVPYFLGFSSTYMFICSYSAAVTFSCSWYNCWYMPSLNLAESSWAWALKSMASMSLILHFKTNLFKVRAFPFLSSDCSWALEDM